MLGFRLGQAPVAWTNARRTPLLQTPNRTVTVDGSDQLRAGASEAAGAPVQEGADRRLYVPADDEPSPEVSIVVPACNEELTIGDFVDWSQEGLRKAGVRGEVLIIDSSEDHTREVALEHGARVLSTPRRGLGRAYIDAIPFIRGRYVVMGDADCTYDFRELSTFLASFREGHEFVMGSRWRGTIEPGSMPWLHEHLGTPVTTWILNLLYGSHFTDIHCGMRGITTDALRRMRLQSQSWEYASEMVLKSVHMRLNTAEVPVRFLKDREGRVSHHKRLGWFSPFQAAWINLRSMFIYGADFFLLRPGLALLALGLIVSVALTVGPIHIGGITLSLYTKLLGMTLALVGLQSFFLGCLAQLLHDYSGTARRRWLRIFPYTRSAVLSGLAILLGLVLIVILVATYIADGFRLTQDAPLYLAVTGLLLLIGGCMTFTSTLLLHATALRGDELYGNGR